MAIGDDGRVDFSKFEYGDGAFYAHASVKPDSVVKLAMLSFGERIPKGFKEVPLEVVVQEYKRQYTIKDFPADSLEEKQAQLIHLMANAALLNQRISCYNKAIEDSILPGFMKSKPLPIVDSKEAKLGVGLLDKIDRLERKLGIHIDLITDSPGTIKISFRDLPRDVQQIQKLCPELKIDRTQENFLISADALNHLLLVLMSTVKDGKGFGTGITFLVGNSAEIHNRKVCFSLENGEFSLTNNDRPIDIKPDGKLYKLGSHLKFKVSRRGEEEEGAAAGFPRAVLRAREVPSAAAASSAASVDREALDVSSEVLLDRESPAVAASDLSHIRNMESARAETPEKMALMTLELAKEATGYVREIENKLYGSYLSLDFNTALRMTQSLSKAYKTAEAAEFAALEAVIASKSKNNLLVTEKLQTAALHASNAIDEAKAVEKEITRILEGKPEASAESSVDNEGLQGPAILDDDKGPAILDDDKGPGIEEE